MTAFFILGLAWLMPLHFMPWVSWHGETIGFIAAVVLVIGVLLDRRNTARTPFEIPRTAIVFSLVALVVLVQAAAGLIEFWGDALVLEIYLALCVTGLACGFVQATRASTRGDQANSAPAAHPVLPLATVLLACATLSSVIALVQVFDVWPDVGWIARMSDLRRPGGNLAQPNHLGTLLLMGLVSLVLLRERGKLSCVLAATLFTVLALGLAVTESRTALLGLVLLSAWAFFGRAKGMLSISPKVIGGATLLAIVLYIAWPLLMASGGAFEAGATVNAHPGWRLVVWPQLLQAIATRPWQGWGLHEVAKAHNAVASSYEAAEPYTYAHNLVLELALGWGIPLTLLVGVAAVVWFWKRAPLVRTNVHWYCIAAVLPFCVHSMLEFPYAYSYFLLPVMFLVGVFEAETVGLKLPRFGTHMTVLALVPVLALAVLSVYDYLRVEEDFRVARFQAMRIGRLPADYSRPKILVLTQLDALLDAARLEPRAGMSAAEIELARQAAMRYPWPATQNRYALALALNGMPAEAVRQLQVIRTLHGEATFRQIETNWRAMAKQHPEWAKMLKN